MTESDSINSLQSASLDMDVDDAIITISGHCMKLARLLQYTGPGPHGDHYSLA